MLEVDKMKMVNKKYHIQAVWGIGIGNGDIVTAGSDKTGVFSRVSGRQADSEIQKIFIEEVEKIRNCVLKLGKNRLIQKH